MATVKAIKYGMKGDEVSNLQTTLKNAGYSIDVDGSFGPQTLAAVKDYQQKNGLTVDGMVGPQTQAALFGGSAAGAPANTTSTSGNATGGTSGQNTGSGSKASPSTQAQYPNMPKYDAYEVPEYVASDTVTQAQAALNAALAAQPGAYQSKWQGQINEIIDRILNREEFSYDVNEDALYQQYAEQYRRLGKLAMQDTTGQMAAMTGGYGNSFAATAGNQAFQAYLAQLNEMVPELYGMARDQHNREGQEMYEQYGLLSDQEAQDYGRYQDGYNKWLAERDFAAGRYESERDFDYGEFIDERNLDYQVHSDKENREWNEYLTALQNDQWETSRMDKINSEDRAYAREDVMAVISAGGTPTTEQLALAGMSRKTAEAMKAISSGSGGSDETLDLVSKMSTAEIVDMLESYASDGNDNAVEIIVDDLYLTGRITEEQWKDMKKKYKSGNTATDTTVATKPNFTGGGGGKIMEKY